MRVPELARVLRAAGLTVIETPGWLTRDHGPLSGVRTIVCHHTAGPATGDYPSLSVVRDGRPGLAGPLAQLGLARSGVWYCISAGKAWHAGTVLQPDEANEWAIGIEAEATGHDAWPAVQYNSYARGCRALIDHFGLSVNRVLGHKEVCSPPGRKTDPNFDMAAFRRTIAALGSPSPPPPTGGTVALTRADALLITDVLLRERLQRHVDEQRVNVDDTATVGELLGRMAVQLDALTQQVAGLTATVGGLASTGVNADLLKSDVDAAVSAALSSLSVEIHRTP